MVTVGRSFGNAFDFRKVLTNLPPQNHLSQVVCISLGVQSVYSDNFDFQYNDMKQTKHYIEFFGDFRMCASYAESE